MHPYALEVRMEVVRCLLRSRTDYITIRSPEFVAPPDDDKISGWTRCLDCRVNIRANGFCSVCKGSGYRRRRSERETEFDRYTGVAASASNVSGVGGVSHDREETDPVDRRLAQRETRNVGGSLDRVERGLLALPDRHRRVIQLVYTDELLTLPNRLESEAVRILAETIPGRLEPPHWLREGVTQLKREKIRQLASEGVTQERDIARCVGVSRRLVRDTLSKSVAGRG